RPRHRGTFSERVSETAAPTVADTVPVADKEDDLQHGIDFSPAEFEAAEATEFAPERFADGDADEGVAAPSGEERGEGFRAPGDPASTAELLKFLIDRTGYIKQLEQEDTPEALARK